MDWAKILELGHKALELYKEGDKALEEFKLAATSSKEALTTSEQGRLDLLLTAATTRRVAAAAELELAAQPK